MEITLELLQSPIIIITVLVVGTICETLRRLVGAHAGDPGLRGLFYILSTGKTPDSQGILPLMLCIPLCFIPWLPPAECLIKPGFEYAARIGTYLFAGVTCKIGYDLIMGTVMGAIRHAGATAVRETATPAVPTILAAPTVSTTTTTTVAAEPSPAVVLAPPTVVSVVEATTTETKP